MRIFTPVAVGPVELRNRILTSGHTTNMADDDGLPLPRLVDYHRARARGGVGLIISSGVRVHPLSKKRYKLGSFPDGAPEAFGRLASAIHDEGAKFFVQLSETGRTLSGEVTAPWSASDIPWRKGAPVPHALATSEIADIVKWFRVGTRHMREAGVDGIEVQFGHGLLLQQFLSPVSNTRTDAYGGTLRNRLRIGFEVIEAVEQEAGDGMAVGVRISGSEFVEGGLDVADMLEAVGLIRDEFPIDFLNVSHSAYIVAGTDSMTTQLADMYYPVAPFRSIPKAFKEAFPDLPIIGVCRIDDLDVAEELLATACCDLVALTRAHIADPDLVAKYRAGQQELIRRCVSCNQGCVGNLEKGVPITCTVNPHVGREGLWDQYAKLAGALEATRGGDGAARGKVLVVGGGPAGMEAAIACREEGYAVTVLEREGELGGQLRLARRMVGRERWNLLVDDQTTVARRLGIDIRYGVTATAADIVAGDWDHVVVATGCTPRRRDLPGYGPMLTIDEAVAGDFRAGGTAATSVVVFDDHGGWPGIALAYHLARQGHTVGVVSEVDQLAWDVTLYSKAGHMHRMGQAGVSVHLMRTLRRKTEHGLEIADAVSGRVEELDGVAEVVWVAPGRASDGLVGELEAAGFGGTVHLIGDAYAPRDALEAVREGRSLGQLLAHAAVSG
jgi:dimethylglycine catabolism A